MPATIKSTPRLGDVALADAVATGFGRYLGAAPGTAATRAGYQQLRRQIHSGGRPQLTRN